MNLSALAKCIDQGQRKQADLDKEATQAHRQAEELRKRASEDVEARGQQEQARLQALALKRKADEQHEILRLQDLKRQQEQKVQENLRCMGVCIAGFRWIKQSGGYRCAGGSHFVTDAQLGI